jgi:methylmalonyl-CoA/ethylmalonyl-CoA epimerase
MIFDHIGLFTRDLATGRRHLGQMLPVRDWSPEIDDPAMAVRVQFAEMASGPRYELVAPFGPGNPVEGVLAQGKTILNHVAYRVVALDDEIIRLRALGALPLAPPRPAIAFDGRRVVFLITPMRFILELIEAPPA